MTGTPAEDVFRGLDCTGATIAAGQVNAHTHIYSALAPLGMPAPDPPPKNFLQILERVWWRLDRALDRPSLHASARLYAAEALLHGTTCLIDHHESPGFIEESLDVLADACQEIGVRAVLCYGATERNGGREEAERGLAECRRFITSNARPNVRGVVGLHASFTVSDATIREAAAMCRELGAVMHVHLAEDAADVRDARDRGYDGPLERLLTLEALPEGSIVAHGVHLDASQVRRVHDAGCWIVQNPRSNRGNRVGYPRWLSASDRVALGTDGYPAHMAEEEAVLAEEARVHGDAWESAKTRLSQGWALASLHFGDLSGDQVARTADGARHVAVSERRVVVDGQLRTGDVDAIRREAVAQARPLWKRMRRFREE